MTVDIPFSASKQALAFALGIFFLGSTGCVSFFSGPRKNVDPLAVSELEDIQKSSERITPAVLARLASLTPNFVRKPTHDRIWRPEYSVLPIVESDGWNVTIRNVRDNRYRSATDYDVRFYDLTFPLTSIESVDFIVVPFQSTDLLAHTMLSFGLNDGRYFTVSVEARLEPGESYSATGGAKGDFELMYVVGDERDLLLLRTHVRKVDCYLYPGRAKPDDAQRLFADIMARINSIARTPEFYHTLQNNCTTNLVDHVNRVFPDRIPYNWRILLPGRSDRLAFDLGLLNIPSENFEASKPFYRVNAIAELNADRPDFSSRIRTTHAYTSTRR